MVKLITAVLCAAAVFYAVYMLLGKKRITEGTIGRSGRYRKIFLTAAVAFMSILPGGAGGCRTGAQEKGSPPAVVPAQQGGGSGSAGKTALQGETPTENKEAWDGLAALWSGIVTYTPPKDFSDLDKVGKDLDQIIEKHDAFVQNLLGKNEIDQETGVILAASFREIAGHFKRMHSGKTCYDMTSLGVFIMETKEKSLERLGGLEKLAAAGTLTEEAAAKVKADIARDLYFFGKLDAVEKEFEKSSDYKAWDSKVGELQKFYTESKNVIAKTDPSFKATDLIIKLLTIGSKK